MASIGYDAEWQIVSAASVGAPHRRDRVIIVAYPTQQFSNERGHEDNPGAITKRKAIQEPVRGSNSAGTDTIGELADPNSIGHLRRQPQIFTTDRWLNAFSLIGSCSADVANTDSVSGHQQHQRQVQQPDIMGRSQVVADPDNTRSGTPRSGIDRNGTQEVKERRDESQFGLSGRSTDVADNDSERDGIIGSQGVAGEARQFGGHNSGREKANVSREWWQVEPDVGRVAHGVPSRVDRLRGLGNAVVPQVAELIGRMVIQYDTNI
jgi:DNA (cytosine-5)-methyltransferase 1